MRIARTLSFYLIRETAVYCGLAFFLLTFVLLTQNLLRRLESLFLVGMTAKDLGIVIQCVLPIVVSYSLPLAFLVGILLALRRMGSDGELEGMRSAGFGPTALVVPLLAMGILTGGISGWLLSSVEHESRRELVRLFKNVAARGAILEPGKFRYVGNRLIFVEDRDRSGALHGVMIVDQSQPDHPYRIFASRGRFRFEPETAEILLELSNGDMHLQPDPEDPDRYERILFEEFAYRVDVGHILGGDFGPVRPKQMDLVELRAVIERSRKGDPLRELDQRDPIEYEIEIHRRRTLPFAPLLFAGVGVPIALANERRGRNHGLILSLLAALGYYALAAIMEIAAREAWLGVGFAIWVPNLVFAALAVFLIAARRTRIPR
jgi:lipopolysaccharide export system permease protein